MPLLLVQIAVGFWSRSRFGRCGIRFITVRKRLSLELTQNLFCRITVWRRDIFPRCRVFAWLSIQTAHGKTSNILHDGDLVKCLGDLCLIPTFPSKLFLCALELKLPFHISSLLVMYAFYQIPWFLGWVLYSFWMDKFKEWTSHSVVVSADAQTVWTENWVAGQIS
jgi:hypothetical protein